ncbi:MAG: hypothetical protein H7175_13980, partial [Burkholderiales bacterium]|nr:hypothetical protein [Anaerolineae bacterium]
QTLMAILNSLVPTLSEFRPDVPPSLEVLINRMLSKSKEDRIDSVRQVGAELEAILRSLDTQARANVRDILPATSGSRFTSATPTPAAAALPFSAEPDESRTPEATPSTKTPFSDATPNSYTPSEIRLQADTGSRIPIQMHSTESGQRIFVLRSGPSLWGLIALLVVGVGAVALALFAIRQQNPGVATATPVSTESAAIVVVPTTEEGTIAPTLTVAPSSTPGVRIGLLPQAVRTTGAQMPYVLTAQAGMDMAATRSVEMTQTATAASPTPLAVAIAVQRVAPVAADEFMVLVAQPEAFGGNERNVARFIISDLRQSLEEDVPFSQIRVREYPAVITSEDEALAAADANGATMVIWGNYDDDGVELTIQLGVTDALPHVQMERDQLEQVMNVRVRLDSERRQSVVPQVLSILGLLEIADGNAYEAMRTVAVMDAIEVEGGEVVGDSVAANTHRFYQHYLDDTIQAIEDIDAALELDASNPLLYASRSLANQRMGDFDEGRRSAETALRLGPPGWTLPL